MSVITHSKFMKRRAELEKNALKSFYELVTNYVEMMDLYIKENNIDTLTGELKNINRLVKESKNPILTKTHQLLYFDKIKSNISALNISFSEMTESERSARDDHQRYFHS